MVPNTPPPRNAATSSLSLTPFRLKTASVPTEVKLLQAVPLDDDLQNELEGAYIVEDPLSAGSNHFVQYLFQQYKISQSQPSVLPSLSDLMDADDTNHLYNTTSRCWQPIYLPHILRFSPPTASARTRRSSTGGLSSRKARMRSMTITRTIEDPNSNSVVETEEVTCLPKPGLEEGKLAVWLNQIVRALESHRPGAGRVTTRSQKKAIADNQRYWSAEFATKAVPSDVKMKMKPDVALLRNDPFYPNGPNSWRNVAAFLELTSADDFSGMVKQILRKSYAIFTAQPGRRFVIALSIFRQNFRLHLSDRSGALESRPYSIHANAVYLIRILYLLAFAPEDFIGYDPTLVFSLVVPRAIRLRVIPTIKVGNKTYTISHVLCCRHMIRGRATLCFVVQSACGKRYVVKISWVRNGRATTEEQMLNRIKERGMTHGVPKLVAAWTVQIGGKEDTTALRRPGYLLNNLREGEQPETRIQRRLVLDPVGDPLQTFLCIQELISIFIDIVDVHEFLVKQCDILHRDLSITNVISYPFDYATESWPITSSDPAIRERLCAREKVLTKRGYRRGLLIDFDYAKFTDEVVPVSDGERTGTIPFMALDVLSSFTKPGIIHEPKHDLESIIYILVWMSILHTGPNREPAAAHTTCLKAWADCKSRQQVEALWSQKTGELSTQVPLQHFTPYFMCLNPFVVRLYRAVLSDAHDIAPLTHDILRGILLEAFFQVSEPSVTVGPAELARQELAINVPVKRRAGKHTSAKRARH